MLALCALRCAVIGLPPPAWAPPPTPKKDMGRALTTGLGRGCPSASRSKCFLWCFAVFLPRPLLRRRLRMKYQAIRTTRMSAAIPPITPPAIAPAEDLLDFPELEEIALVEGWEAEVSVTSGRPTERVSSDLIRTRVRGEKNTKIFREHTFIVDSLRLVGIKCARSPFSG